MMLKRASILFGVWLGAFPVHAATYTSPSVAYSDVSATVATAAAGDTVVIPAGSATWGSTLTISKSIYLIGSGTNASGTHISGSVQFISVQLASDGPVRISGIWFTMGAGSAPCIQFNCKCLAYRIDHCLFDHSNQIGYGYGKRCICLQQGLLYGVIDHNTFINWDIAIAPQDDEDTAGTGKAGNDSNYAWTRPYVPGTTNVCCIEDNCFRMDSRSDAVDINEQIYHWDAPRTIIRYNLFDSTGTSTPAPDIDAHGNQSYWGGCQLCTGSLTDTSNDRATVGGEIYCNTFNNPYYRFAYLRGGSWLIYSNILNGSSVLQLTEEESWQTSFFSPLATAWPAQDQIENTFVWGNIVNGSPMSSISLNKSQDSTFIQQGRDYFLAAPAASGQGAVTGTGKSTIFTAGPSLYYPYKPLVYPHPLVSAGSSTNPPPPAPTGLHIINGSGTLAAIGVQ